MISRAWSKISFNDFTMKFLNRIDRRLAYLDSLFGEHSITWSPIPDSPQQQAYYSPSDELLFGGQAGGGKSDLILGLAITQHKRSLILRRRKTDLSAIISRARDLTGALGTASMIIGDRLIEFGGCKDEASKIKYKGRPHDLKCFDELSEFTQSQYEFITAWNRTADPGQRCRIIATTNPPDTNDGRWILERWAAWLDPSHPNPAQSGELRWFLGNKEVDGPEPVNGEYPRSRTFIRSSVEDNPYMLASGYDRLLDNLPDGLREKLRYGDFTFEIEDNPRQLIPTGWIEQAQQRYIDGEFTEGQIVLGVDPARGGRDRTVIAVRRGNRIDVYSYAGSKTPDGQTVVQAILQHWVEGAPIHVDVVGIGASVVDRLREMSYPVVPLNFGSKSVSRDRSGLLRMLNLRAECYWKMRDFLDPQWNPTIAIAPDSQLLTELSAARYRLVCGGIQVESKEEIYQRLLRSPDLADAVVMAAYASISYSSAF